MVNPKAIPLKYTIFAAVLLILSVPISYTFMMGIFSSSIIWAPTGFAFAFLFVKGKDIAPVVFIGVFIGYVINYVSFDSPLEWRFFSTSFLLTVSGFSGASLGAYLTRKLNIKLSLNVRDIVLFALIITLISGLTALLGNLTFIIQGMLSWQSFFDSYTIWFLGDLYGIIIFGLPMLISLQIDKSPSFGYFTRYEALFFALLILFSAVLFTDYVPYLSFGFHKYFYIPFAVVAAIYFPVRTLYLFSLTILLMVGLISPFIVEPDIFVYMSEINILLVILTIIAIVIKITSLKLDDQLDNQNERQKRLKALVGSMREMFSLSNQTSTLQDNQVKTEASKIFRMVFKMFDVIDYGSCAFISGDKVHFIDAIGFDLDMLNSLPLREEQWIKNLDKPQIFYYKDTLFKNEHGDEISDLVKESNPFDLKESLFMSVALTETITCEFSFDISQKNQGTFRGNLVEYFEGLNTMLNTFFEANRRSIGLADQKNTMVVSLLKAIDLFDKYTRIHSEHVADIAREIGWKIGLSEEKISELYWAGIVHDIGKIGVDIKIIDKPGELTVEEYESIKKHSDYGYALLKQSSTLKRIAQYVRHHHEHYDGNGYPSGLSGNENLQQSYVLGLSEAIASMMEDRVYSKKLDTPTIIGEIKKENGYQFDPGLCDIAIDLIENGLLSRIKKDKT
jgi:HD-GYP domain-containing protein (c-di-GMP phosphodiesterase class II)